MRDVVIAAIALCIGLIGLGYYFATRENSAGPRLIPLDASYTARVDKGGWAKGAANPKVTVIEYGDMQCPACQAVYAPLNDAIAQTESYAQLVFKEYPLPQHNNARIGARAVEAAGRQGKFWEMHDLLYARQTEWESDSNSQFTTRLEAYAKELQLNVEQFKNDLQDSTIDGPIDKNIDEGNKVPVAGTPTLIINGKVLSQIPKTGDELVQLIKQANPNVQQP